MPMTKKDTGPRVPHTATLPEELDVWLRAWAAANDLPLTRADEVAVRLLREWEADRADLLATEEARALAARETIRRGELPCQVDLEALTSMGRRVAREEGEP